MVWWCTILLIEALWSGHSPQSLSDPAPLLASHSHSLSAHHNISTNMKLDITEGTYVNKKDKDFLDYLVKCGRSRIKLKRAVVIMTELWH